MLSNEVKELINEVINLYSSLHLSQDVIDKGTKKLESAKMIILNSTPNTLKEFSTVKDMKMQNLSLNDLVKTKGYYTEGDGGEAVYIIKDYEYYLNNWLPEDCRKVGYKYNLLNTDLILKDSPVDEYGNHTLNNGLVACLYYKENIKPEQYGCIADGKFNNVINFQHLFAHMKHGKIEFKKDGVYMIGQRTDVLPEGVEVYSNPYGSYMGGRGCNCLYPTMANIDGVELVGDNSTIKVKDNDWNNKKQGNDFAILNLFRVIRNLTICGLIFDGNGLTMGYDHSVENHGIAWKSGNARLDGNKTAPIVEDGTISEISNFEVYDCEFRNGGTAQAIADCGGDGILIINPMENSHDINIHHNKFTNWGRWVFAIDLGGNGECIENVKFNNNTCIQDETNKAIGGKYRGLGWIDFEAKKCFKNLEVNYNYVYGANGWAFNGNDKVSENISIIGNTIITPNYDWRSRYPYMFNFYYVQAKNVVFKENNISLATGSNRLGNTIYNLKMENNKFSNSILSLYKPFGNIIIENNIKEDKSILAGIALLGDLPNTLDENDRNNPWCNIIFKNNEGGFSGNVFDVDNPNRYNYINFDISGNKCNKFNLVVWDSLGKFTFDPSQVENTNSFSCRGAVFTSKSTYNYAKRINGGGIYKAGDLIAEDDKQKTICVLEGYVPMQGTPGFAENDMPLVDGRKPNIGTAVYTDTDVYLACNSGIVTGVIEEVDDELYSGNVRLRYITKLAQTEIIKK